MHWIDWTILVGYILYIVWHGLKLTKKANELEGYFVAGRSIPWWAVGLSVMATQLSAITMIGTTGQGYADGMRFIQFYYALPIAMLILSVTFVPFFHGAKIFTAYEYLERRFDAKTRSFTAFLFLISRAMSCGAILSAPSVVLSVIMGTNVATTCLLMGLPTALYTMFGGVQAVTWTDVKQMVLIVSSLIIVLLVLIFSLPPTVNVGDALHIAGMTGRLQTFDFRFDLANRYTFWSGTIASLFLFMSYFGTDQSQVQRYLSARSVDEARISLFMSAYWKIPLQALVLLVGIFVFVFYLFQPAPMLFNASHETQVFNSPRALEYAEVEARFNQAAKSRQQSAEQMAVARHSGDAAALAFSSAAFTSWHTEMQGLRQRAVEIVKDVSGDRAYNDVNFVFPTWVTTQLPIGVVGMVIAAIFAAAMSAVSAELAALSTASVIDFYRRWIRPQAEDRHYLVASRFATAFWGLFASVVAIFSVELGSLIEVVNRFGSFFYGSILGVFLLAIGWRRATGNGAFIGLLAGMAAVAWVNAFTRVEFLWHNLVGAVVVFVVGMIVSAVDPKRQKA